MTALNKAAADVITTGRVGTGVSPVQAERRSAGQPGAAVATWSVHALTDITGFGLIGHAREMALASNVSLVFQSANIPLLEGALDCIRAGHIPGGLTANREFAECLVGYDPSVPADIRTLLFDPQTAGGLLISASAEDAGPLTRALQDAGVPAVEIGQVLPGTKPLIRVTS
jgi:selenide,water dikinase